MTRKDYSFLIFNHTGSPIKRMSFSRRFLAVSCSILAAFFISLGLFGTKFFLLKERAKRAVVLESRVLNQEDLIDNQKEQIQDFAVQINELKQQLSKLNDFEKKMRVIANLDTGANKSKKLSGVGGSMPDDLDPTAAMKERQTALIQEMHEQVKHLDQVAVSQKERFKILYDHLEKEHNMLACTPSISPIERGGFITSGFGYRTSPFTGKREFHCGLDIAAPRGTPIVATADGVVVFSGKHGLLGNTVIIDNGYGIVTRFGHAEKLVKKRGDKVKRGDVIAYVGSTGRSTGPHVHYEVLLNGVMVNPKRYLLN